MPCTVLIGDPPQPCGNSTSQLFPNHCPLHLDLADSPWPDDDAEHPETPPIAKTQAERIAYARRVLAATPMFGPPKLTPTPTSADSGTNPRHSPKQTQSRSPEQTPSQLATSNSQPGTALGQSESRTVGKSPLSAPARCSALTRSGDPCGFSARKEFGLCVNHDPSYKEKQNENTRKGGRRSAEARFDPNIAEALPLHRLDFSSRADIQATVALVARLELFGRISPVRSRNLLRALSIAARNVNGMGSYARQAYPDSASYLEHYLPELLNLTQDPPPTESTHEKP